MNENQTLVSMVNILAAFGTPPTRIARSIGLNASALSALVSGERAPSDTVMLKLENLLRESVNARLAGVAQAVAFDGGSPAVARAFLPAVRRLHDELQRADDKAAYAGGWPEPLSEQERRARLDAHQVGLAMIEANEASERAELERSGWDSPAGSDA